MVSSVCSVTWTYLCAQKALKIIGKKFNSVLFLCHPFEKASAGENWAKISYSMTDIFIGSENTLVSNVTQKKKILKLSNRRQIHGLYIEKSRMFEKIISSEVGSFAFNSNRLYAKSGCNTFLAHTYWIWLTLLDGYNGQSNVTVKICTFLGSLFAFTQQC